MKPVTIVTGGSGFLGSLLVRRLVSESENIVILKRASSNLFRLADLASKIETYDITDQNLLELFTRYKVDRIIHCATTYGRGMSDSLSVIESNLVLPVRLLEYGVRFGVREFVNTDTALHRGLNAYSLSKKQFVEWLQSFSSGMVCINVTLEHFYGPSDDRTKFVTRTIFDLLKNVPSLDLTLGEQRRDFIYIDDVVEAFVRILAFGKAQRNGYFSFEVGTGESFKIRDFAILARDLCNNTSTELKFGALSYREQEVMESKADIEPLRELGWKPTVKLREGLQCTIEQERKTLL